MCLVLRLPVINNSFVGNLTTITCVVLKVTRAGAMAGFSDAAALVEDSPGDATAAANKASMPSSAEVIRAFRVHAPRVPLNTVWLRRGDY